MKFPFLIFLLLDFVISSSAQKGVEFEKSIHDFGDVLLWNNPEAAFLFTNNSESDLLFLPTFSREDVFVKLPKGKISAGTTDTIFAYYFTASTGPFEKSVELYTSQSRYPLKLTLKGNILSLNADAFLSCPGFAPKLNRVDDLALLMTDSTAKTQLPKKIEGASTNENIMLFEEEHYNNVVKDESPVLPESKYSPNNIVFLIDISSSMRKVDKLPLLKISMKNLAGALRKIDFISVIVYSSTSVVALPATRADNKEQIMALIDGLSAAGFTNGILGLENAYQMAGQNFIHNGNNQIIIATDGKFNSPNYSESKLIKLISKKAESDIKLSVVAFGDDKNALKVMQKVAEKGNGSFIQIADEQGANEILIDEIKLHSVRK